MPELPGGAGSGRDPATRREADIRKKRLHFGLVFQSFNLFPQYTALENVVLARKLMAKTEKTGESETAILAEGKALLEKMGLADRMENYPHQLSGGQQQRPGAGHEAGHPVL